MHYLMLVFCACCNIFLHPVQEMLNIQNYAADESIHVYGLGVGNGIEQLAVVAAW